MGNRLSKIVTRTGDKGTTGLANGNRVDKDNLIIETIGTIDELNSNIGLILSENLLPSSNKKNEIELVEVLHNIQHHLFDMGGELSLQNKDLITAEHINYIEDQLYKLNDQLPPLKEFILPNGTRPACLCHLARSICRKSERRMVALSKNCSVNQFSLIYLNRLSDFLFVCSRYINLINDSPEELWKKN